MHYLMVCMPQEHTYSTLVSLPVGVFYTTTAVWLLELYPAKIVQTFQWFREQCSFKLIYVPNASWEPLGIAP